MHPVREKMNRALKAVAVPKLRALGFKGSFPHFRLLHEDRADLIVFQFNKYGGSFVVEIACLTSRELVSHWNTKLTLGSATVYDSGKRHRLGAKDSGDHWFTFGKQNDQQGHEHVEEDVVYERIAERVVALLESDAKLWWAGFNLSSDPDASRRSI